jgi:hypothetical protein
MGNNCKNCFSSQESRNELGNEKETKALFTFSNYSKLNFESLNTQNDNINNINLKGDLNNKKFKSPNKKKKIKYNSNDNLKIENFSNNAESSTVDSKIYLRHKSAIPTGGNKNNNKNYKKIYSFNIKDKVQIKKIKTIQKTFRMFQIRNLFKSNLKHIFLCEFYEILNKKGMFISLYEFLEKIPSNIKNKINLSLNRLQQEKFFNSIYNPYYIKTFPYLIVEQPFYYNSNCIYYGEWNYQGQHHGYGILLFNDNSLFEGYFINNKINGTGKIFYNNDDFFEGEIKNNMKCGKGKYVFENGSIFTGDFCDNKIEGYGILNFNENKIYKGIFTNNYIEGNGEFIYSNKTKYVGNLKKNLRNGFGTYYYNKEETIYYKGNWKDGFQDGEGEFKFENGKIIKGLFEKGKIIKIYDNNDNDDNESNENNNEFIDNDDNTSNNNDNNSYINNIEENKIQKSIEHVII